MTKEEACASSFYAVSKMTENVGKYGNAKNHTDDGQNQYNGHDDQLRFGPVAEGIFLGFITAPDKEHDQIYDTTHQRDAGNQGSADPAADGNGFFGNAGTVGGNPIRQIAAAVGTEASLVMDGSIADAADFHKRSSFLKRLGRICG